MPRYSFVVPIYNDGCMAGAFCDNFALVMSSYLKLPQIDDSVELIFVNDGSRDNSQELLNELSQARGFVRTVEFSRNFGHHTAVACGYRLATGDYVGMMNVDMQDPPDQIPILLNYLVGSDYDLVIGIRPKREDSFLTRHTARVFHAVMNFLTDSRRPTNQATLRVMTRRFVDAYNRFSERGPYLPGLEEWLGFKQGFVEIQHRPRAQGRSSYTFIKKVRLAFDAVVSFSDLPLTLTAGFGLVCSIVGFLLCFYLILARLFMGIDFQPGFTSTVSLVVFLGGIQILSIGLLSIYVGRILREAQKRPRFIIKRVTNMPFPRTDATPELCLFSGEEAKVFEQGPSQR